MKRCRKYAFKVLNVRVTMHVPSYAIVILTRASRQKDNRRAIRPKDNRSERAIKPNNNRTVMATRPNEDSGIKDHDITQPIQGQSPRSRVEGSIMGGNARSGHSEENADRPKYNSGE